MTTEEKAVLIGLCRIEIRRWDSVPDKSYMVELMNIALAALTAEPVAYSAQDNIDGFGGSVGYMWPPGNEKPSDFALYKCARVAVPEGWRMVPVEPTQEMVDAHMNGVVSGGFQCGYRAMLAAAPPMIAINLARTRV